LAVKFVVQWDEENKRFRVAVINVETDDTIAKGEWTLYKGIAKLQYQGKNYIAVSQYHDGQIPGETVLEVIPAVLN
jgi:hypothetical protein